MSQPSPNPQPTRRTWLQPRGRLLVLCGAALLVLVIIVGVVVFMRGLSEDAWVADESYAVDVCSLPRAADLEPLLRIDESDMDRTPEAFLGARDLTYQHDSEGFADHCWIRPSPDSNVAVELIVSQAVDDEPPESYSGVAGEALPALGDAARFYPTRMVDVGVTVTHIGEARVKLKLKLPGSSGQSDVGEHERGLLVEVTRAVIERFPDSYVMPGELAGGGCAQLMGEAAKLFDADPTYSRSHRPDPETAEDRSIDCSFAHANSAVVRVTMKADTPGLADEISGLDNFETLDVNGTEVFRDDYDRHYVVGPDERSLAEVHLIRQDTGTGAPPSPTDAESAHLTELAEAALRSL